MGHIPDAATDNLRRCLRSDEYAAAEAAGRDMRDDDAANEVLKRLHTFSGTGEKSP